MPSDELEFVCPKCHAPVERVAEPLGFGCAACSVLYLDVEGIPCFLIDQAVPWERGVRTGR
jgi:hypothetical protein